MIEILKCLKKHGERLDAEIAEETGMSLAVVREGAADLAASGALIACSVSRFDAGKRTDAWLYRASGFIPRAAPGRRAKPKG